MQAKTRRHQKVTITTGSEDPKHAQISVRSVAHYASVKITKSEAIRLAASLLRFATEQ